jgi:hypothetical protein
MDDTTTLSEADVKEPDEIRALKSAVDDIRGEVGDEVRSDRATWEDTRYCVWDGQSTDGRKHGDDLGKKPMPFEGASDARIRLADKICNENVKQLVTACTRVAPKLMGVEGSDDGLAGKLSILLRWLIRSKWGAEYRRTTELLAQYCEGDSPAAAVAFVDWHAERALEKRTITAQDLILLFAQWAPNVTEAMIAELADVVTNPLRIDELTAMVGQIVPGMRIKRMRDIAQQILETGTAEFPAPYYRENGPKIVPLRIYEDVFFHANVTDIQRAPVIFLRQWLTRAEILERAATEGWDEDFVTGLLGEEKGQGHEGQSGFDESSTDGTGPGVFDGELDRRRGHYEIVTAYRRSVDEDGIMGIYVTKFSYFLEVPAKATELFDRQHGKLPFVYFSRECLTSRILDARGVPELAKTSQNSLKLISDSFEDMVQVTVNPPLKIPTGKAKYQLALQPFGQMELGPRENVEYLETPTYPALADNHREHVERENAEYFGRPYGDKVDPALVQLHAQDRVDRFLWSLADCFRMVLQLSQQYMPDEQLQRIVGGRGVPIARSREEIQGQFDLYLSFDVRDLDLDNLAKKAELLLKYARPMDVRGVVPWERMTSRIVQAIDVNWAEDLDTPAGADAKEIDDQKGNLAKILAGIRPMRPEGGLNYPLRLSVVQEDIATRQANPTAFPALAPASAALLQEELEWLQFQAQQQQNAVTGRKGYTEQDLKALEAGPAPLKEQAP